MVHELLINLQNFQVYIFFLPARGKIPVIKKENQTEFRYFKKTCKNFSVFMHAGRSGRLEPLTDQVKTTANKDAFKRMLQQNEQ